MFTYRNNIVTKDNLLIVTMKTTIFVSHPIHADNSYCFSGTAIMSKWQGPW